MATEGRPLTGGEAKMARSVFGAAVNYERVRIHRAKWAFFQPAKFVMSPDGDIWVHPKSENWSDDYAADNYWRQELFMHEMTHVWQAQTRGKWFLPTHRHPFCRYEYQYVPGRPFTGYGLEQQAEIVRHVFSRRMGWTPYQSGKTGAEAPPLKLIEPLLPFGPSHDA